jgi:hypothetical protein
MSEEMASTFWHLCRDRAGDDSSEASEEDADPAEEEDEEKTIFPDL